jgi:uncharacterized protein YhdP
MRSDLPAPLAKGAGTALPLRLERQFVGDGRDRVSIALGNLGAAQLQRRKQGAQYALERANIVLGASSAPAPDRAGVWVRGAIRDVDIDRWLLLMKASPGSAPDVDVAGVDVKLDNLKLLGRRFSALAIAGNSQGGAWPSLQIAGPEVTGELSWRPQGRGKITARLKSLSVPPAAPTEANVARPEADKSVEYPALDIVADRFQLRDKMLGKLELSALPDGRDWKIERLRVSNPDATLTIDGVWQGWITQPRTAVNVDLQVNDIGKFLVRLGYPEGVHGGTAKLTGPLSWSGSPAELDYATLAGKIDLQANKGQFVKLDPGVGKLLGILSLQSLPRRLTLDFSDVFSKGMAFDEIAGSLSVGRGIATTQNFRIQGPAARVVMSGDVDLNAETQKLTVKVYPALSDSLSVAGALLGGPAVGLGAFLAQKVLQDPFDKMTAHEYSIAGTWADPQISKLATIRVDAPAAER